MLTARLYGARAIEHVSVATGSWIIVQRRDCMPLCDRMKALSTNVLTII